MKIAVCDDDKKVREQMSSMIKRQAPDFDICQNATGENIISAGIDHDIYFLDIEIGDISGIELAKKIRSEQENSGNRSIIIFVTAFREYMEDAFDVNAFHYLVKPIKEKKFAEVFQRAVGLSEDELAFYDALTNPQAIKDFCENDELIAITKELTEALRKNRSIDWQKRDSARAKMRMMIKRLLKKHKYPPEGMDDAVATVMLQCELWTDNNDMEHRGVDYAEAFSKKAQDLQMVAEEPAPYGTKKED